MISGLPMLMLAAAQPAPAPAPPAKAPAAACSPADPTADPNEIVICVEKPDGYRIDPAIIESQRQAKRKKLKRPERHADNSCESVGIMGCRGGGGVNILSAVMTAAEMAKRAVNGENVGEMFITEPQPDEYQLYLEAKRKREAQRAEQATAAQAKTQAAEKSAATGE